MRSPGCSARIYLFMLLIYLFSSSTGFSFHPLSVSQHHSSSTRMSLYSSMVFDERSTEINVPDSGRGDISIPYLSPRDLMALARGERVEKQSREGRKGVGVVVVDVFAPAETVFETLCRFSMYEDIIPTVRSSKVLSSDGMNTMTEYLLSRFMLRVNVLNRIFRDQRVVKFRLDDTRQNMVFREAQGFWYVEQPSDRPFGWSRVYLSASIVASPLFPSLFMDYAASRALPRASKWIQPHFAGTVHQEVNK